MQHQVQIQGITYDDIQRIFEQTIAKVYPQRQSILYLDIAYLYTFDLSDINQIQKFTDRLRTAGFYDNKGVFRNPLCIEWHRMLERWYNDQTVTISKPIKPIQIGRTFDRVVNEALELIAAGLTGNDIAPFQFHAIGDGNVTQALPSDTMMVNEVDRIDVTEQPGGGGLSRDGSTVFIVGNHDKGMTGADMTEMGAFDAPLPATGDDETTIIDDHMLAHEIFPDPIEHLTNQDAPGGSIIIFQCAS